MTSHEGTSVTRPPLFDGMNFSFWKVRMRTYLMALGANVWDVVETGYIKPVVLASKDDKLEFSFNAKGMNAILNGLVEAEFVKVMHLQTAKEMWDKLINSYEGNEKVKYAKLQTYRVQFEKLQMKEDETVGKYFMRLEEMVNAMKALGETIGEPSEELNDLKTLSFDQLLGMLTAYEMRIVTDKPTSREASFKADKNEDSEPNEIEEKFVRRLKKGSGKYQGKFPFKCFNCGRIGHFANKCPHKGKDQTCDDEEKYKHRNLFKENNFKKKSLCANNEDDPSNDEDNDSSIEDKLNDFMLMAKENYDNKSTGSYENDEEVVVDMEGELISALEEIDRLRIKNKKQKQFLIQFEKDSKQPDEYFALLKVELEEERKIEDILKHQLLEKRARSEALEEEVVKTRKEMEKFQALYNKNLSSIKALEGLATILNQQRNPKLKTGLGYEEGSSSGKSGNEEPIKFVKSTTNDNNKPVETKEDNQLPRTSKGKSARTESIEQRNNALPAQRHHQHERNRFAQRRQPFSRYKDFFYGYCFYCSNFGHKDVNCSLRIRREQLRFPRNKFLPQQRMIQQSNKPSHIANCQIKFRDMQLRRSRINKQSMSRQPYNNNFDVLNNEIEFYNCHNFGHKAANCHLKNYKADPRIKFLDRKTSTWKRKDSEKCGQALSTQKQKASGKIDSGCSKHMTGDKDKLLSISKRETGNVILENDEPGKIKDRGMMSLSNDKGDSQYVMLVDGLKHNSLSSSQKCDRGSEDVLTSKECKVKVNSGQMVNNSIRTNNNVDVKSSPASKE
jgi:hypothetical protein